MSKKVKKDEIGVNADTCTHYECDNCVDKFSCDYYIDVFCRPVSDGFDDGYGNYPAPFYGQNQLQLRRQDRQLQEQDDCREQLSQDADVQRSQQPPQQQQNSVAAGYGYTAGTPIPAPGNPNGVQLSPIIIPVSFVPYTTQNQPLYQVETVMPEKEFVKHHGLSFFMLVINVLLFFAAAFPVIASYTGMNMVGGLSVFIGLLGIADGAGFEALLQGADMTLIIGASLAAVGMLFILITAIYNTVKYIGVAITGKLKKGLHKSNVLVFFCVIAVFVAAIILNAGSGTPVADAVGLTFINDASLAYRFNFGYYALLAVSALLMFSSAFIKTERYSEVEGVIQEEPNRK
ncbi:MAG: hypothetical protein LBP79_05575 [Clostridiales bacterium]|jgi:hypothetical protein|nr:hypothetical protein [Clostridiales bacterium]